MLSIIEFDPVDGIKYISKTKEHLEERKRMKDLATAKEIINNELKRAGLKVEKIILFGSRAKGNFKSHSDWDFLIVVDTDLDRSLKRRIVSNIRLNLVYADIPADVILVSQKAFEEMREDKGYLIYYALKYGIAI